MAKKKSLIDTKTALIILLVLAIIGIGYIVVTNLPEEIDFLTVDEVVRNKQGYVGQDIIVKGYYDKDNADRDIVVSEQSAIEGQGRAELKLDLDKLRAANETDDLRTGILYFFTGTIVKDETNPVTFDIILMVEEFEET